MAQDEQNERPEGTDEPKGPQFEQDNDDVYTEIDKAKSSGWSKQVEEFFNNARTSVLAVVAVIAALVIGFFVVNALAPLEEAGTNDPVAEETNGTQDNGTTDGEEPQEPDDTEQPEQPEEPQQPEPGNPRVQQAASGEGITHLARRAISQTLQQSDSELNAEQMVYAEDYLQNRVGDYGLALGQTLTFDEGDINDAIERAQNLTPDQLESLERFTTQ
ncbi:MAG: hypothetical protein WD850_02240 [Candidatus Spechtbacterales bacterium]